MKIGIIILALTLISFIVSFIMFLIHAIEYWIISSQMAKPISNGEWLRLFDKITDVFHETGYSLIGMISSAFIISVLIACIGNKLKIR